MKVITGVRRSGKLELLNMFVDYIKEIDFIAMKRDEKLYIQVSDNIGNDFENETFKREIMSLLQIKDAYPKKIIARIKHNDYQYEGVQIIDISNWLIRDK